MRYLFIIISLFLIPFSGYGTESPHPFSDHIEALWIQGEDGMSEAKKVAENRLTDNPNDIVGLLIIYDYQIGHMNLDAMTDIGKRINSVIDKVKGKSENFRHRLLVVKRQINMVENIKGKVPVKMIEEDRKLIGKPGRKPNFIDVVRLCEEEGLVSMADLEERNSLPYYWAAIPLLVLLVGFVVYRRRSSQKGQDASA